MKETDSIVTLKLKKWQYEKGEMHCNLNHAYKYWGSGTPSICIYMYTYDFVHLI